MRQAKLFNQSLMKSPATGQVMLVHKGAISVANREGGGAVLRLTF